MLTLWQTSKVLKQVEIGNRRTQIQSFEKFCLILQVTRSDGDICLCERERLGGTDHQSVGFCFVLCHLRIHINCQTYNLYILTSLFLPMYYHFFCTATTKIQSSSDSSKLELHINIQQNKDNEKLEYRIAW